MNLLAHALLAYATLDDTGGQECTGSMMADFFAGQDAADYPAGIQAGMAQHRDIDGFTDTHPSFIACRRAIAGAGAPRFTAGILTDIFWDHVLASDWKTWGKPLCALDLEPFCAELYTRLGKTRTMHSPGFARAYSWIVDLSWLTSYAQPAGIEQTLQGLSTHMSGNLDLAKSVSILASLDGPIRAHFAAFWPDLVDFARGWAGREITPGAYAGNELKHEPTPSC